MKTKLSSPAAHGHADVDTYIKSHTHLQVQNQFGRKCNQKSIRDKSENKVFEAPPFCSTIVLLNEELEPHYRPSSTLQKASGLPDKIVFLFRSLHPFCWNPSLGGSEILILPSCFSL